MDVNSLVNGSRPFDIAETRCFPARAARRGGGCFQGDCHMRGMRFFTVAELSTQANVAERTIREYRAKGLLPPVARISGRLHFGDEHLTAIQRISEYQREGLNLAAIRRVMAEEAHTPLTGLLREFHRLHSAGEAAARLLVDHGVVLITEGGAKPGSSALLTAVARLDKIGVPPRAGLLFLAELLRQRDFQPDSVATALTGLRRGSPGAGPELLSHRVVHAVIGEVLRLRLRQLAGHCSCPDSGGNSCRS
ncbi:MerR family transcriptional regulator [Crossiella sp. CA198]|uniref:MerR family transcriptional regulator n=1 Tax=Crossiella sp. CA198 TaxID=3455607 RepID=UPI003F8D24AC